MFDGNWYKWGGVIYYVIDGIKEGGRIQLGEKKIGVSRVQVVSLTAAAAAAVSRSLET